MAFGITRAEMLQWKERVARGEIAFLTHYWYDPRFPNEKTVTKVGCSDLAKLTAWCLAHELDPAYIHHRSEYPHMDLLGERQRRILLKEQQYDQIERFLTGSTLQSVLDKKQSKTEG